MTEIITRATHRQTDLFAVGEVSSVELTRAHLEQTEAVNPALNASLHVNPEGAPAAAATIGARWARDEELSPLAGTPAAMKDNFCATGMPTACGSRTLEGWVSPCDVTIIARLKQVGLVTFSRISMDEFAIDSSTKTSAFGPSHNSRDLDRIPDDSRGGLSVAAAGCLASLTLGSDTGGSVRQPGAATGIVGVKPTYGGVSRYGVVMMVSSLDQSGPITCSILDTTLLHAVMGGYDPTDSMFTARSLPLLAEAVHRREVRGPRIGAVKEFGDKGYDAAIETCFIETIQWLRDGGAEVVEVSYPHSEYTLTTYYLIIPAELSSNLARFNVVRYGLRFGSDGSYDMGAATSTTRGQGSEREVKHRPITGTYALPDDYHDQYYGSIQKVRIFVARDFEAAFVEYDILVSPTTPTVVSRLRKRTSGPMVIYKADLYTTPSNLAGNTPASFLVGLSEGGLPVGLQTVAPPLADDWLYRVGDSIEAILEDRLEGLLLKRTKSPGGTRAVW